MKRFVLATLVIVSFGLAVPAPGQTTSPPALNAEARGNPITLSEEQKQAVIDAAVAAKSRQKTPKEFSPSIGALVPKEVYLHGFKPDETQKIPLLKEYMYAFLDREVVLVGGPKSKVVAIVGLPEKLFAGEQPDQGASEASSDADAKRDKSSTSSVPSHTSPETIK